MIEDVIKALECNIRKTKSTAILILERYKETCRIKAFLKLVYILWYKEDINSPHLEILRTELTDRVISEEEQLEADKAIRLLFLESLFDYLKGDVIWKNY